MGFDWWRTNDDHIRQEADTRIRTVDRLHEPFDHPLTVEQAHRIMQQHKRCLMDNCLLKQAAWQTLVDFGKIKPDSGRTY